MSLILVVSDDRFAQRQVRDHLELAGYRVLIAGDTEIGLRMVKRDRPDMLVLDLDAAGGNGLLLIHQIRKEAPNKGLPILLLTQCRDEMENVFCLEWGVDDYVCKPVDAQEVVARVNHLLNQGAGIRPRSRITLGELILDLGGQRLFVRGEAVDLTPVESELLHRLMVRPGQVHTREELIHSAQTYALNGQARTLDAHIHNIRRKIESDPNPPAHIQTIHAVGYCFTLVGSMA